MNIFKLFFSKIKREKKQEVTGNRNLLTWGIHRGTKTSRDIGDPRECHSLKEAIKMANDLDVYFRRVGCMIWFATWWDENGKEHKAHPDNSYR